MMWPQTARATMLESMTVEEMSRRASTVVQGTVLSMSVDTSGGRVRTAVRVDVAETLKGASPRVATVYVPGGRLPDGTQAVVDGMPSFRVGESCCVFVDRNAWVVGGYQGKIGLSKGRVRETGESVAALSTRVRAAVGYGGTIAAATAADPKPATVVLPHALSATSAAPQAVTAQGSVWLDDGFESGSISGWDVIDPGTWGVTNYRASTGTYSAYCMGASAPGAYPNDYVARMVRGPYDLSASVGPELSGDLWCDSEMGGDLAGMLVSTDGVTFEGSATSGQTGAWMRMSPDLHDISGGDGIHHDVSHAPKLWVMLIFRADSTTSGGEGLYFDDITLKDVGQAPVITSISPGSASAGTGSYVTVSGSGFGTARGDVGFAYGRDGVARIGTSDIRSWSDTAISCEVPVGIVAAYNASAGSGPVVVTTAGGAESNGYAFHTTFGYGQYKYVPGLVTYRVNTSGIDSALRERLVDAGAAAWSSAGSSFRLIDGGTTIAGGLSKDSQNTISWADGLPDGVIGWAQSYTSGDGVITESDVQFSNEFPWGDGMPGSGTMDVQSIATHELGHWLNLRDQYGAADSYKVMYGMGSLASQKRTLSADDIAGIRWIYGTEGADAATSITIRSSATTTYIGRTPMLRGSVTPPGMIGRNIVVYVQKPGKSYWTYSSTRTVYSSSDGAIWMCKYYFRPGMTRGVYRYKAVVPARPGLLASSSSTIAIRLR